MLTSLGKSMANPSLEALHRECHAPGGGDSPADHLILVPESVVFLRLGEDGGEKIMKIMKTSMDLRIKYHGGKIGTFRH